MNSAPFPPFTSPLGRLRLEGMYFFHLKKKKKTLLLIRLILPSLFCIGAAVIRPCLDKLYLDWIDQVCSFSDRSFHGLVTFGRLAAWGLGLIPTAENLGHEDTTQRSKCRPFLFSFLPVFLSLFFFLNF